MLLKNFGAKYMVTMGYKLVIGRPLVISDVMLS